METRLLHRGRAAHGPRAHDSYMGMGASHQTASDIYAIDSPPSQACEANSSDTVSETQQWKLEDLNGVSGKCSVGAPLVGSCHAFFSWGRTSPTGNPCHSSDRQAILSGTDEADDEQPNSVNPDSAKVAASADETEMGKDDFETDGFLS